MKYRTRRYILGLYGLLGGLGLLLAPAPSWALSGFDEVDALADTNGSTIQLLFACGLALEDGDPTPPQGLAVLDVTGPTGTVYDLLNSQATASNFTPPDSCSVGINFPDSNGDGLPDIPLGDYVFRVRTTSGAEFLRTKRLTRVIRLAIPTRLAPANNARVTTTPTFQWQAVSGGVAYRVVIFRSRQNFTDPAVAPTAPRHQVDNANVFTSPHLTGTSFTLPPGVLSPGRAYYWDVQVLDAASLGVADNRTRNDGRDVRSAFAVLGLYAEMELNRDTYRPGDTLQATVRLANTANVAINAFGQVWVGLPTGAIIPLGEAPLTIDVNLVRAIPVLTYRFTGTEPVGAYAIGVQLQEAATGHRIGNETVSRFTFSGP